MKRLASLGVGTAVILSAGMMSATPAFADNGPHVSTSGQYSVDRCAGCHRAHTAQFGNLLTQNPTTLCQSCHGTGVTGATTDVIDGVGYNDTGNDAAPRGTSFVGALRAGGFTNAAIDGASGSWGGSTSSSTANKSVSAFALTSLSSTKPTTSAHKVNATGTMWGSGAISDPTVAKGEANVTLECTSCHDPHGNASYRILKPQIENTDVGGPTEVKTWAFTQKTATTLNSSVAGTAGTRGTPYTIITNVPDGTAFHVGDPVTFWASSGTNGFVGATVTGIATNTLTISYTYPVSTGRSAAWPTPPATNDAGFIAYANPQGLASVTLSGSVATYKTWNLHGLFGDTQRITFTGFATADKAWNFSRAAFTVVDPFTFTIDFSAQTPAIATPSGNPTVLPYGTIAGIPDAKSKVYTTANYWAADDHNYTGTLLNGTYTALNANDSAANKGPTAFIANISQWCTQCHTRLLAGSGAYDVDSGDAMYTYRHRSQSAKENSPNCIQCHVAHGSNVSMSGDGTTAYSSIVQQDPNLGGPTATTPDSFLLRVDNRGTCNMCHNK